MKEEDRHQHLLDFKRRRAEGRSANAGNCPSEVEEETERTEDTASPSLSVSSPLPSSSTESTQMASSSTSILDRKREIRDRYRNEEVPVDLQVPIPFEEHPLVARKRELPVGLGPRIDSSGSTAEQEEASGNTFVSHPIVEQKITLRGTRHPRNSSEQTELPDTQAAEPRDVTEAQPRAAEVVLRPGAFAIPPIAESGNEDQGEIPNEPEITAQLPNEPEITAHVVDDNEELYIAERTRREIIGESVVAEIVEWDQLSKRKKSLAVLVVGVLMVTAVVVGVSVAARKKVNGPPCSIDLSIECRTADGRSCSEIRPPSETSCITALGGALRSDELAPYFNSLTFVYSNNTCGASNNLQNAPCRDSKPLERQTRIITQVSPSQVGDSCRCCNGLGVLTNVDHISWGETFEVNPNQNWLLDFQLGEGAQHLTVDVSGVKDFHVGDRFGALQLVGCRGRHPSTVSSSSASCLVDTTYRVNITNSGRGTVKASLDDIRQSKGLPIHMFNSTLLDEVTIAAGDSIVEERQVVLNTCEAPSIALEVNVTAAVASTDEEGSCGAWDTLDFSVPQIEKEPVDVVGPVIANAPIVDQCGVTVNWECFHVGDFCSSGTPCLVRPADPCRIGYEGNSFFYNGGGCNETIPDDLNQPDYSTPLVYECTDFNGGPQRKPLSPAYIVLKADNYSDPFERSVIVGENFHLPTKNLGSHFSFEIFDSKGGTILQRVRIHSSCLADHEGKPTVFGSLAMSGEYNEIYHLPGISDQKLDSSFDGFVKISRNDAILTLVVLEPKGDFSNQNVLLEGELLQNATDETGDTIVNLSSKPEGVKVCFENPCRESSLNTFVLKYTVVGLRDGEECMTQGEIAFKVTRRSPNE